MDDMKIFLINLDRQEQDTGSAWFTLPCDIEEMKETIGLSVDSELVCYLLGRQLKKIKLFI